MIEGPRTYLVECFTPGIDEAAVAAAGDRARAAALELSTAGLRIDYLGALLMSGDEVVFHAFASNDPAAVASASTTAGLTFERIVESVGVDARSLPGPDLTRALIDRTAPPIPPALEPTREVAT
jgi:hypothetical protein